MFTFSELNAVKSFLEIISKMKKAYTSFKATTTSKIDLQNVVEKYFAFEGLQGHKVSLTGKLSNYTITTNFPVYSPRDAKDAKIVSGPSPGQGRFEFKTVSLNVPALAHNQIILEDGSKAKVIWLYTTENSGLVFQTRPKESKEQKNPLSFDNLRFIGNRKSRQTYPNLNRYRLAD